MGRSSFRSCVIQCKADHLHDRMLPELLFFQFLMKVLFCIFDQRGKIVFRASEKGVKAKGKRSINRLESIEISSGLTNDLRSTIYVDLL